MIKSIHYIALIVLSAYISKIEQDENYLFWDERNELTINDFNHLKDSIDYLSDATAKVGIFWDANAKNDTLECMIRAFADVSQSVYIGFESKRLLKHENGHFDLAEIQARKIRKIFLDSKCVTKSFVNGIFETYLDSLHFFHEKYDNETMMSMNEEAQNAWNKKIEMELKELENYCDIMILVPICEE